MRRSMNHESMLAVCGAVLMAGGVEMAKGNGSLLMDTRAVDVNGVPVANPKIAPIAKVGDVINGRIYVTVLGSDGDNSNEGLQAIMGSLQSTIGAGASSGAAIGKFLPTGSAPKPPVKPTAAVAQHGGHYFGLAPFGEGSSQNQASQNGTQGSVDLDPQDGSPDFGDQNKDNLGNFVVMRSLGTFTDSAVRVFPQGGEFLVGSFSWTVQGLGAGGATYLNFYPRKDAAGRIPNVAVTVFIDGFVGGADSTTVMSGDPIVVGSLPEPSSAATLALGGVGLTTRVRRRK